MFYLLKYTKTGTDRAQVLGSFSSVETATRAKRQQPPDAGLLVWESPERFEPGQWVSKRIIKYPYVMTRRGKR